MSDVTARKYSQIGDDDGFYSYELSRFLLPISHIPLTFLPESEINSNIIHIKYKNATKRLKKRLKSKVVQ